MLLVERGHAVRGIARNPQRYERETAGRISLAAGDIHRLPDGEIRKLLAASDTLVYAIGADEREAHPSPVYPYYRTQNVDECVRVVQLAKEAGVRKLVLLGSYFVYFDREWPELNLAHHHPYIRSRVEQEREVLDAVGNEMTVSILQLPYIFGTMKGRAPIWSFLVKMIRAPRVVYFPKGGTAMVTVSQVAQAIAGAVEREGPSESFPIGGRNLTWVTMIETMLRAMDQSKKVVTVPASLAKLYGLAEIAKGRRRGEERGLNPVRYMDFQKRYSYIDPAPAMKALGYGFDDLDRALTDTVRACLDEA